MTFVTAEIGANWLGDFELLEFLVVASKKANINAIKLQALTPEILARHQELTYYESASVNQNNINEIDRICRKHHMEWYCTPTSPDHVELLEPFVNRYKIRTADNENKELCDKVFATGKRVIISSQRPLKYNDERIKNLYCIPRYPTQFEEHNFNLMQEFDGFSNHCLNPLVMLKAVMLGAKYLEFHLTPTKDVFTLDNHVSYTIEQFIEVNRWISLWNLKTRKVLSS